jgi:hypothetical protein
MEVLLVEPKTNKFTAYLYDGTTAAANEACSKWPCVMTASNSYKDRWVLKFEASREECLPGQYIVNESKGYSIYSEKQFLEKYEVVYDNRNKIGNFLADD